MEASFEVIEVIGVVVNVHDGGEFVLNLFVWCRVGSTVGESIYCCE